MFNFRGVFGCLALTLAALAGASAASATDEKVVVNRFPFDPACAWGRLADGKGMVIRCLTESEAAQLAAVKMNPGPPSVAPAGASAETAKKESSPEPVGGPLEADVVSVTADEGNLPIARRKLRAPREKYAKCVTDNGGLTADVGETTVRFLVRELARAEGTSVEKRQGMSEAAAKCIAAVVDRRPVGTPEGPMVGATAVIRVTKQPKPRAGVASGR